MAKVLLACWIQSAGYHKKGKSGNKYFDFEKDGKNYRGKFGRNVSSKKVNIICKKYKEETMIFFI